MGYLPENEVNLPIAFHASLIRVRVRVRVIGLNTLHESPPAPS